MRINVYGDINGSVYDEFGLDKNNRDQIMKFFITELGLKGIRFDEGISGEEVEKLTHNKEDIKVILNASNPAQELEYLLLLNANKNNLIGYWNFYPQRYTASLLEYFLEKRLIYKKLGVPFQTFVLYNALMPKEPWQHNDKLPSIEMHRDATLDFQVRHFVVLGVEDIIVSTQFFNR